MFQLCLIEKGYKSTQIYFKVHITYTILELVQDQLKLYKESNISISQKYTKDEYIAKIRALTGINVKYTLLPFYEEQIKDLL